MNNSNFTFFKKKHDLFYRLGVVAEDNFTNDPNTTLLKLRQLGEAIAQDIAARFGCEFYENPTQVEVLNRLSRELRSEQEIFNLFHTLRKDGNKATHQFHTVHKEALNALKISRRISIWYYQSFVDNRFQPEKFIEPKDPSIELRFLQNQIRVLTNKLTETNEKLDDNEKLTELLQQEKEEYQVLANQMDVESREQSNKAKEIELALKKQQEEFEKQLQQLRDEAIKSTNKDSVRDRVHKVSKKTELSEEETRIIIDLKLYESGWEADSQDLTYAKGARPEKGKNLAIAEWPCSNKQSADYVLFAGLTPIGIVEAKKENVDVSGKIQQAERYSKGFKYGSAFNKPWTISGDEGPWDEDNLYQIPFVYSCNGRPFVKQLAEKSGTWFRDVRKPSNIKRALESFHTPDGLIDLLKRDKEKAEELLKKEGFSYLGLRDYQKLAIEHVENALKSGKKRALLAMATGTGKTRTIMGLMYRMLKAERFKRILFLVDRRSLGNQALDSFKETNIEQNQPLSSIYNIAELKDMANEAETRIQVATVQAMVKRLFISGNPQAIDAYDCIIVDEAHRGYTLDQEMTEGELLVRDTAQYLSTYRRVLDYFDATLIGLTATPAKHTTEIFGNPVYTYSYREAVADDWLIDHEPPITYKTKLSENGIKIPKGKVSVLNNKSGKVETAEIEDELDFKVESFNRSVINENFDKVVCEQLVNDIDPTGDEKTMIFCTTDMHADRIKRLLDESFKEVWGDEYREAAVRKLTGSSDKIDSLIKQYKNERYPSIAITVDLLTTGIDVPKICNLVFLRRVKSRILYEQMIGRATRRCDDIGKTVFHIFDPVGLYESLQDVSTMKPIVKNPNIPLSQLLLELSNPESYKVIEGEESRTHADGVLDDVSQRVMRVLRKAEKRAERKPEVKKKLEELRDIWGIEPKDLHSHLHKLGPKEAIEFINTKTRIEEQLEEVKTILVGTYNSPVLSDHEDEFLEKTQKFGNYEKPEDYLESFNSFIKNWVNEKIALSVMVKSPKDLKKEHLKEIKVFLDQHGYTEASLQTAWKHTTHKDVAASIVGYIRRAALGEQLVPFEERVNKAMENIYQMHPWTIPQKKWLGNLAKQLNHELVIDEAFVNNVFRDLGGSKGLNKRLDNRLHDILDNLSESLWVTA